MCSPNIQHASKLHLFAPTKRLHAIQNTQKVKQTFQIINSKKPLANLSILYITLGQDEYSE